MSNTAVLYCSVYRIQQVVCPTHPAFCRALRMCMIAYVSRGNRVEGNPNTRTHALTHPPTYTPTPTYTHTYTHPHSPYQPTHPHTYTPTLHTPHTPTHPLTHQVLVTTTWYPVSREGRFTRNCHMTNCVVLCPRFAMLFCRYFA